MYTEALINDFINRSFRDSADQDYITARVAHKLELDQQFRWCALQAIEKYLKAILLYNRVSSKNIGHNLNKALSKVNNISDLNFSLPSPDLEGYIDYISTYGADRYFTHPTHLRRDSLILLDKTVWSIRRYCFFMRQILEVDGNAIELFEKNLQKATNPYFEDQRHKYRIFGGYLEKVIDKSLPSYKGLVWKNFFYGRVKKHQIKNYKYRMASSSPTHDLHPEIFSRLVELVDFPKKIKEYYENQ